MMDAAFRIIRTLPSDLLLMAVLELRDTPGVLSRSRL